MSDKQIPAPANGEQYTLEEARAIALELHPEAKEFEDLLLGNTIEDIIGVAADVATRVAPKTVQSDFAPNYGEALKPNYVKPEGDEFHQPTRNDEWNEFFRAMKEAE